MKWIGIDHVALVATFPFSAQVADNHAVGAWKKQVVQPLCLGALFEGDVHRAAHAAEELEQGGLLRRHD